MRRMMAIAALSLAAIFAWSGNAASARGLQEQQAPLPGQKTIKDPVEYNAYMTALNNADAPARGAVMEAFAQKYPLSVMFTDALEQAMSAYQQAGNQAKLLEVARRLMAATPNHVRALAIIVAIDRGAATGGDQNALKEGCMDAQTGMKLIANWIKPEGMNEGDFEQLRKQLSDIFYGAAGFCALQSKDYASARAYYGRAFQLDPTSLQDVYQFAVAGLEAEPIEADGFWYCAKAIAMARRASNLQAASSMTAYCQAKYKRYHGAEDGWSDIAGDVARQDELPAKFASQIKKALTPAEMAVQAVEENGAGNLGMADWIFILQHRDASAANKDAAEKVWSTIQSKEQNGQTKLRIPGVKVIAASSESVDAAITDEAKAANRTEIRVMLGKPVGQAPMAGATIDVIGVITAYAPQPFLFTMEQGELAAAQAPRGKLE